jgi:nicotinamide-nucleotide adenylyltransferase
MDLDVVRERLERLHASESHAIERFDEAEPANDRLVVLPSAFNPPTEAHLALMRLASAAAGANPAALLTTRNVAKGIDGAPLEHRVGMLLAARTHVPGLVMLAGNSARFVDQARAMRGAFPGTDVDFVAGYDTLVRLFDPKYYEDMQADLGELFRHHRLVATNRGDETIESVERFIEGVGGTYAARIVVLKLPEHSAALSSTLARNTLDAGGLGLTPPVRRYIAEHGLYR